MNAPVVEDIWRCSPTVLSRYRENAAALTTSFFGRQRSLFNPLYISNVCINDCAYCGYRRSNDTIRRRTLKPDEIDQEALFLARRGISKILLLAGEFPGPKYLQMLVEAVLTIKRNHPEMWIGLESAPLAEQDYDELHRAGVDAVVLFQESYDASIYAVNHRFIGPKQIFFHRRHALARAVNAGILEVGLGVLYGLGQPLYETEQMHQHGAELLEKWPGLRLRFSFPRLCNAPGQREDVHAYGLTDDELIRAIVSTRLRFPSARLVLTARESMGLRISLCDLVTDFGEAGSTVVGGYTLYPENETDEQFTLPGRVQLPRFIAAVKNQGYNIR